MSTNSEVTYSCEDYAQSANTLFHFMSNSDYLKQILINKAIVPRYCIENIEYLNISNDSGIFKEVAILQKCFCDIPFHKLTEEFELSGVGMEFNSLSEEEKLVLKKNNTHPEYYGKYAIALSKMWGENRNLQPIHYLNDKSLYTSEFNSIFNMGMNDDSILPEYTNDMLNRLAFCKPIRGIMKRTIKNNKTGIRNIEFYKNFHDEKEWRYVPSQKVLEDLGMEKVIANPNMLANRDIIFRINKSLETDKYNELWLKYNYDDIRYIVVPDLYSRKDLINTIINIPEKQFDNQSEAAIQKYILISKILVWEEVRKDW
ncbi:MAG: abortive infection system antitoxin AbiGi family protein [Clostridium sp.]|uniref:abortive infection system antitoxin AbiGi family protein n=1 Tax=Clostridium sp. TaxID=1506 RepID=UPI002FC66D73